MRKDNYVQTYYIYFVKVLEVWPTLLRGAAKDAQLCRLGVDDEPVGF